MKTPDESRVVSPPPPQLWIKGRFHRGRRSKAATVSKVLIETTVGGGGETTPPLMGSTPSAAAVEYSGLRVVTMDLCLSPGFNL